MKQKQIFKLIILILISLLIVKVFISFQVTISNSSPILEFIIAPVFFILGALIITTLFDLFF